MLIQTIDIRDENENDDKFNHNVKRSKTIDNKLANTTENEAINENLILEETITYPDGSIYSGQTMNGLRFGKGLYKTRRNEVIYQGLWKNDNPHGEGKIVIDSDLLYIGEFIEGVKTGIGKITSSNEQKVFYSGNFLNGEKHDFGQERYPDNSLYVGQYYQGKKQGKGKYYLENGNYYEGEFADDKMQGKVNISIFFREFLFGVKKSSTMGTGKIIQ